MVTRQGHARALDLLGGGHHLGGAVDDLQAVLVDAQAFEQQVVVVLEAMGAGDGDREGVADGDRAPELEGLAHIHGARAGNSVPRMDEISTLPHIEWPTTSRNWLERANSGSTWVGLTSPDITANRWMSSGRRVRTRWAESPMAISSNVRFWMKSCASMVMGFSWFCNAAIEFYGKPCDEL
jgi:hypothetical protein